MLVKSTRELVSIPSVSGMEDQVADYILEQCVKTGCEVERLPGSGPGRGSNSVAAWVPGSDPEKVFVLLGHTDTVIPERTEDLGSENVWSHDPFTPRTVPAKSGGRAIYGAGSSDMKSGLAVMLDVLRQAARRRFEPTIYGLFAEREETDSLGAMVLSEWFREKERARLSARRAIGGLILEPTKAAFVGVGHRGDMRWEVSASGPGGHPSRDWRGQLTASRKITGLVQALDSVHDRWEAAYSDPLLGSPSVIDTSIRVGSTSPNTIPTGAFAVLDVRVTPQMVPWLDREREHLAETHKVNIEQPNTPRPCRCPEDAHIYRVVERELPDLPFKAFDGATDMFAFPDVPFLVLGPGDPARMHEPNESVDVEDIRTCRDMVVRAIRHF